MKFEVLWVPLAIGILATSAWAESTSGQEQYVRYCSACHGEAADGKGPVANVLEPRPPPLTQLRGKYGDPLGAKFVTYVMGETMPRAHGTSDMPVWGRNLEEAEGSYADAVATIWRIVRYLDSIQTDG